ncbi:MAG: hypothetical protein HC842_06755 [Cytophagales bacterium]|nr:hypothetical protein [Cytophagales bacterium]
MKITYTLLIAALLLALSTKGQQIVKDIDGNSYETIELPNGQVWFLENLRASKNPQGEVIERDCYGGTAANCNAWGGLYDYETAVNGADYESTQGICPNGWHIPSLQEVLADAKAIGAGINDADVNASNWTEFKSYISLQYGGKKLPNGSYVNGDGFDTQWSGAFLYTSTRPSGWINPYGLYMANPDMGGQDDAASGGTTLDPPTAKYGIRCKKASR